MAGPRKEERPLHFLAHGHASNGTLRSAASKTKSKAKVANYWRRLGALLSVPAGFFDWQGCLSLSLSLSRYGGPRRLPFLQRPKPKARCATDRVHYSGEATINAVSWERSPGPCKSTTTSRHECVRVGELKARARKGHRKPGVAWSRVECYGNCHQAPRTEMAQAVPRPGRWRDDMHALAAAAAALRSHAVVTFGLRVTTDNLNKPRETGVMSY